MKRSFVLTLTALTLASGFADAARRSGGGFGGRSGSSGSYRSAPSPSRSSGNTYRAPSSYPSIPPRSDNTTRTPSSTQRSATDPRSSFPSNSSVRSNPANTVAAAKVTPAQLSNWNKVSLPAGVPRSAMTYSAAPSSQYRYQLQPGRYYPYPQSYYRQHGIGYDILKYALVFTAVGSLADAMTPDVVVNNVGQTPLPQEQGDLSDVTYGQPAQVGQGGPNLWSYVGVGFLAAAAGWFVLGRRS